MIFQNISTTFCCKDRRTAASFLQQMGVRSKGSAPELLIREVTKVRRWIQLKTASIDPRDFEVDVVHIRMDQVFTYVGFRVGGLGYGPRFRCLQPTHGLMVEVGPISNPHVFQCSDSLRKV